jgi:hypothetical protein
MHSPPARGSAKESFEVNVSGVIDRPQHAPLELQYGTAGVAKRGPKNAGVRVNKLVHLFRR